MKEQNNIDPLIAYHSIVMNSRYRFMPVVANMDKTQILYFTWCSLNFGPSDACLLDIKYHIFE